MLNIMRRSANTFLAKVLLALLALSFGVWGVGNYVNRQSSQPIATVNGHALTPQEFAHAYDSDFNQLRKQLGGSLDKKTAEMLGLKQRTLHSLINRYLVYDAGDALRLTVSPDYLRQSIATNPLFAENNQFDKNRYELLLRNNRMTPTQYEAQLRSDMLSNQLEQTLRTLTQLPTILLEDVYQQQNEKREVATLALNPKKLEATIQSTEEQLATYLKDHQDQFMSEEQVKLQYILLTSDSVRDLVKITQEEIDAYYQEHQEEYQRPESRLLSHILIKVEPQADQATQDAALKKIQEIQKRHQAGETFEALAKSLSEDVSAQQGGSLGEFTPGQMVPAFDNVAFTLPVGQLSDPVKTEFGYHLIRVDEIHPGELKSVAQMGDEIRALLFEQKAQDSVYERSITMEDQLNASGTLETIAKDLNLRYRETEWISRNDPKLQGIELMPKFITTAFSTPKGDHSSLVELDSGRFFALKVLDTKKSAPKELSEVHDAVKKAYITAEAEKQAKEQMETLLAEIQKGTSWEAASSSNPALESTTWPLFIREEDHKTKAKTQTKVPSSAIRAAAFGLTLKHPYHSKVIQDQSTPTLLRLLQIQPADPAPLTQEATAKPLREELENQLGAEIFAEFLDGLQKYAKMTIHPEGLDAF
ncbi:MAG: SurA N-terminal domain-containing protein [Magnetococcus sp. DMHC-6]